MEKNQIHGLLEKYFEGKTTLEEEKILRGFFSVDNSPEWQSFKKHFSLLDAVGRFGPESSNLEERILRSIGDLESRKSPVLKKMNVIRYFAAASVILAVTITGFFILRSQNNKISDTFSDPQLAYTETQKALLFVSQKMNEGMKPLNNITKINSGTEQLKNLEKMDKSLGMLNLVSFINQSSNLKK